MVSADVSKHTVRSVTPIRTKFSTNTLHAPHSTSITSKFTKFRPSAFRNVSVLNSKYKYQREDPPDSERPSVRDSSPIRYTGLSRSRIYKSTTNLHSKLNTESYSARPNRYQSTENLLAPEKSIPKSREFYLDGATSSTQRHDLYKTNTFVGTSNLKKYRLLSSSQPDLCMRNSLQNLIDIDIEPKRYGVSSDRKWQTDIGSRDSLPEQPVRDISRSKLSGTDNKIQDKIRPITEYPVKNHEQEDYCSHSLESDDQYSGQESLKSSLSDHPVMEHDKNKEYIEEPATDFNKGVTSNSIEESTTLVPIKNHINQEVNNTLNDIPSGWDGRPVVIHHLESKDVLDGDEVIFRCKIVGRF